MTFGDRLRSLRLKKDLTQADLAKLLGLGESTISFYEANKRNPDFEILVQISKIFDVSTDYLLGRTDDPSPRPKPETIAASRTDDPMDDLPEEARKSVEEFIEFVYKKYSPDKKKK